MSESGARDDLATRLDELRALENVSSFSVLFYDMIAERIEAGAGQSPELREAFTVFLDREVLHHLWLRNSLDAGSVDIGEVESRAQKRRIGLEDTIDALEGLAGLTDAEDGTRRLIIAECCYHLRMFDAVVGNLEKAVSLGAADPMVHFAIGHNRLMLAEHAFTGLDVDTGERVVADPPNYRATLLQAVSAFENALTGDEDDQQVYWWIGVCLRQAGFEEAAEDAWLEASPAGGDRSWAEESGLGWSDAPPITAEEVRAVGELLKGGHSVDEILGGGDGA